MRFYRKILRISYTKLSTRKSVPRFSSQSDRTKTSWPSQTDANWSGMVMNSVHQVWPKSSCKAQWQGEDDKVGRKRDGKTTSGNGQAWSSQSPRGWWRTEKKWRKLVVKSPVVPQGQRPPRLSDRWRWRTILNWNSLPTLKLLTNIRTKSSYSDSLKRDSTNLYAEHKIIYG